MERSIASSPERIQKCYPLGSHFGRLTVIGYQAGKTRWGVKCQCTCGKEIVEKHPSSMKIGHRVSCGCARDGWCSTMGKRYGGLSKILPTGEAAFRFLRREYASSAKCRNIEFLLTDLLFKELTQKDCHYCGQPPSKMIRQKCFNGAFSYNGIDRVDSSKGYVPDNVVPCCTTCNIAKQRMSVSEFLAWAKRVAEHCS